MQPFSCDCCSGGSQVFSAAARVAADEPAAIPATPVISQPQIWQWQWPFSAELSAIPTCVYSQVCQLSAVLPYTSNSSLIQPLFFPALLTLVNPALPLHTTEARQTVPNCLMLCEVAQQLVETITFIFMNKMSLHFFDRKMSLHFWDRKMTMFVILLTQLLFFNLSKQSGLAFLICHFSLYEMLQTDTIY